MYNKKLFNRDFSMVVTGQIISLFGNAILRFALPLYLLRETKSAALFGGVTACSFIPLVIFSLFGGVIADRVNKRNIMVILDFSTAVIIGVFTMVLGHVPLTALMICVLMLLYGISGAYQPSVQASIPLLNDSENLMKANAVINIVSTLSGMLGPVTGGILFGEFGIMPILYISTACFVISAIMEIFINIPFIKTDKKEGILRTVKSDIRESTQFIKKEKPVFIQVTGILALFNFVLSAAMITGVPVIIVNILHMDDEYLGITQGAMGLGGLAGGMLASFVSGRLKISDSWLTLAACSACALIMGLSLVNFVPAYVSFWIITAMCFCAMSASAMFGISMLTIVQQQTPNELLGKIMAVILAVSGCSQPLGNAVYGILFDVLSAKPWIILTASSVCAFAVSLYSRKIFEKLDYETRCTQTA